MKGKWSGWRDSNSRPLAPHASALPGYATARTSEGSARPARRTEARANEARVPIAPARRAVLPPEVDDPQVQLVPFRLGKERLQVPLGLHDIAGLR